MMAGAAQAFRWRSWLGLSAGLFLLYGAVNVFFAIFVPVSLHAGGAAAGGGLIVSVEADSRVLGRSLATLAEPGLNAYRVSFMDTMCMMMMAFGLLQLAVAWFALREARAWALWSLAVVDVSFIPYWLAVASTFASFGVPAAALNHIKLAEHVLKEGIADVDLHPVQAGHTLLKILGEFPEDSGRSGDLHRSNDVVGAPALLGIIVRADRPASVRELLGKQPEVKER